MKETIPPSAREKKEVEKFEKEAKANEWAARLKNIRKVLKS